MEATSIERRRSLVLFDRREGGGRVALNAEFVGCGLGGPSVSLMTDWRDELLLVNTGFLGASWLFRRAKGGAGGVFF
jgi:hypothetical protein